MDSTMQTDAHFHHESNANMFPSSTMQLDPVIYGPDTDNLYDPEVGLFLSTDFSTSSTKGESIYPPLDLTTDNLFNVPGSGSATRATDLYSPAEASDSSVFTNTNDFSLADFGNELDFYNLEAEDGKSMFVDTERKDFYHQDSESLRRPSMISVGAQNSSSTSISSITSPAGSPLEQRTVHPGRKRGRKPSKLCPEEKRGRRLERGRVAANKCRAKRKQMEMRIEDRVNQLLLDKEKIIQEGAELMLELEELKELARRHMSCAGMGEELERVNISTAAVDYNIGKEVVSMKERQYENTHLMAADGDDYNAMKENIRESIEDMEEP